MKFAYIICHPMLLAENQVNSPKPSGKCVNTKPLMWLLAWKEKAYKSQKNIELHECKEIIRVTSAQKWNRETDVLRYFSAIQCISLIQYLSANAEQ